MPRRPFQVVDFDQETFKKTRHVIEELEVLRVIKKYCERTRDDKEVVRTLEWLIRLVRTRSPEFLHLLYSFTYLSVVRSCMRKMRLGSTRTS